MNEIIKFLSKIDSTVTTLDRNKYDEGWVDTGTIISFEDAIKKLKRD